MSEDEGTDLAELSVEVLEHFDGQANDPPNPANVTFHNANGTRYLIKDTLLMPRVKNTSVLQVNLPLMQSEWPYLAGLAIPNVRPEEVGAILGAGFKRGHDVLQIMQGKRQSDPQALLTRFGLVWLGKVSNRNKLSASKRQRHLSTVKRIEPHETLKKDLERLWTTESFGIKLDV